MRRKLKEMGSDTRHTFTGVVGRFGFKNGYKGPLPTILLLDIRDSEDHLVTDHLWFNKTKGFSELDLHEGDKVQFDARVSEYEKGYKGYREDVYVPCSWDYKLSYPTKIKKIEGNTFIVKEKT